MKILIADNDTVYLNLLAEVLTLHSYEVVTALDGEAALVLLKNEKFDLVISDISMPKINGMNLHRYMRQDAGMKSIPFAWNSGYRELRDVVELEDPTVDFNLDKGIPVRNLLYFVSHVEASLKRRHHAEPVH